MNNIKKMNELLNRMTKPLGMVVYSSVERLFIFQLCPLIFKCDTRKLSLRHECLLTC